MLVNNKGKCAKAADFPVGACKDTCIEAKTDYQGNDLVKGGLPASTPASCCAKCKATARCKYWTFGSKGDGSSVCWVKWASTGVQSQAGRTSGTMLIKKDGTCAKAADWPAEAPGCCETSAIEKGTDYQGSDLIKGGARGEAEKSPEKCCTACKKTPGCKFWSYGYASFMSPKRYACWVKSSMSGWQRQSDRTSGTVQLKKDGTCPKKEDLPLGGCQSYNFEPGIDYQGSDLLKAMATKGYWSYKKTTSEQCCRLCKKTQGCKYWTHGKHKPSGKWTCWVKGHPGSYEVQGEGDSGQAKYGARTSGTLVQNADGSFKKAGTSGIKRKRL